MSAQPAGIVVDYHTHPKRLAPDLPPGEHRAHYRASMLRYAERAAALRVAELGFSEHIYRLTIAPGAVPWTPQGTARGDIGAYVAAVQDVAAACAGRRAGGAPAYPVIRLSIEVDIVPSTVSLLEAALPLYPFDYVLGSVHRHPEAAEAPTPEDAYRAYYAAIRWAAGTGLFHSIAHPDRVHRRASPVAAAFLEEQMTGTIAALARHGVAAEFSGSGVRGGYAAVDPHPRFLGLCHQYGVPVTLGSDAHTLEDVGGGLRDVRDVLWHAGYRCVATFERGRRRDRPLEPPAPPAPQR